MTGEIIYATIFMACFVLLAGVVMYLSKTIDAGEARFDSETGRLKKDEEDAAKGPVRPATRMDERTDNE